MGAACPGCHRAPSAVQDAPSGREDFPGCAHLPAFSPLLHVGNERAAAFGNFYTVVSAVTPKDRYGKKRMSLTTHAFKFDDGRGKETGELVEIARRQIVEGAAAVATSVDAGKKTLVHCAHGQNRSGAICCAYAVLYLNWTAEDAIEYVRTRNLCDRRYRRQDPMHNSVFNHIVSELSSSCSLRPHNEPSDQCQREEGFCEQTLPLDMHGQHIPPRTESFLNVIDHQINGGSVAMAPAPLSRSIPQVVSFRNTSEMWKESVHVLPILAKLDVQPVMAMAPPVPQYLKYAPLYALPNGPRMVIAS